MINFKRMIVTIDDIVKWEPNNIFYKNEWNSNVMTVIHIDKELNKKLDNLPEFWNILIRTIYYILTWPPMIVIKVCWGLFKSIFIPKNWV